ncbi:hypothetical protein PWR63_05670 [Paraburkholderia sp. A2WS-5]|uniref:hypothetical protein n=1 Tax=Paraburkholderia sp. A2WS-5 TaxID=3028372 RepID=UPI003B81A8D9
MSTRHGGSVAQARRAGLRTRSSLVRGLVHPPRIMSRFPARGSAAPRAHARALSRTAQPPRPRCSSASEVVHGTSAVHAAQCRAS